MGLLSRSFRRTAIRLAAIGLFAAAPIGCASSRPDPRPIAECCVCKCNGDLGCLIVRIDDKTPRSSYQGREFYFCSVECKADFDKAPEKFLKR